MNIVARKISAALLTALFLVLLLAPVASSSQEAAWHLVEIVDYPHADRFETASQNPSYDYIGNYARLSYAITQTYVGKNDSSTTPPKVNGESLTIRASSTVPPSVIKRDERVELQLTIGVSSNTQSFFSFNGGIKAYFDAANIGPGSATARNLTLETEDGKSFFDVRKETGYTSINATVAATPRAGSLGSKMGLVVSFAAGGVPMGTTYVYEWRTEPAEPPEPYEKPDPEPVPSEPATPKPPEATPPEQPVCPGVRFGDLHGEVNVKPHWEDEDAYVFAWLTMPLRHDDMIRTRARSGAILSWSDATSFVMGEETIIVLDCAPVYDSKVKRFFGQAWVNFKKMLEDGTMEVEMAQAVAGIKGTTFVLYCDGITSTVKVFEGEVEFRPNNGGVVTVSGGQMVSATDGLAGQVQPFNMEEELAKWDPATQQRTRDILANLAVAAPPEPIEPQKPTVEPPAPPKPNTMLIVVPVALLAVLGIAFGLKRGRG